MENNDQQNAITEVLRKITGFMNLECQIDYREQTNAEGKTLLVSLYAPENARFLIGKNGQNLRALEHLTRVIFSRKFPEQPRSITIDVNDYRKAQAAQAIEAAKQIVYKVRNTKKSEALIPMSSYERRMVHMELAAYPDVTTESIGEEPHRRVVVKLFP
jgi:spoIIIJ-associated protein